MDASFKKEQEDTSEETIFEKLSQLDSDANNLPGVNCRFEEPPDSSVKDHFEVKMHTTDMTFSELYHEVSDLVASRSNVSSLPTKSKKRSYDNILPEAIYFFNNELKYDIMSHSRAIEKGCETSTNPYEQNNDTKNSATLSSNVYDLQSKQDKILECVILESHLSTEANMYDFYKECMTNLTKNKKE